MDAISGLGVMAVFSCSAGVGAVVTENWDGFVRTVSPGGAVSGVGAGGCQGQEGDEDDLEN